MQKNWFVVFAVALGVILLLVVSSFVMSAIGLSQSGAKQDTITVYGQGKVAVAPDIAYIMLGFDNSASSPQMAQQDNAAMIRQITAALREAGIAEEDIQKAQFNVYQEYYYGDTPDAQSYRASSTIRITVRQVDRAGEIITTACAAGANTSYGITYDLVDRQDAYEQALSLARARADDKAAELSEELGRSLGGIVEVREYGVSQYDTEYLDYGYAGALTDYAAETASPGGLEIIAVVYVTYTLD